MGPVFHLIHGASLCWHLLWPETFFFPPFTPEMCPGVPQPKDKSKNPGMNDPSPVLRLGPFKMLWFHCFGAWRGNPQVFQPSDLVYNCKHSRHTFCTTPPPFPPTTAGLSVASLHMERQKGKIQAWALMPKGPRWHMPDHRTDLGMQVLVHSTFWGSRVWWRVESEGGRALVGRIIETAQLDWIPEGQWGPGRGHDGPQNWMQPPCRWGKAD